MNNQIVLQRAETKRLILCKCKVSEFDKHFRDIFAKEMEEVLQESELREVNYGNDFIDYLKKKRGEQICFYWLIKLGTQRDVIGFIRTDYSERVDSLRIRFAMRSVWRNKGYMKEALGAIISFYMDTIKVNRMEAFLSSSNEIARNLLEQSGFLVEGIMRQAIWENGMITDLYVYGMLRD